MKQIRVLHERRDGRSLMTLAAYDRDDGARVYGVAKDGEIVMTGTKAEAKEFYGNWRKM